MTWEVLYILVSSNIHILPFQWEIKLLQCLMTALEPNNELDVPVELGDIHCRLS